MRLTRLVGPAPAVSLALAKAHLRVCHNDEDALIAHYIAASHGAAERHCDRAFGRQTLRMTLSGFPAGKALRLPRPPFVDLVEVTYTGGGIDGEIQPPLLAHAESDLVPATLSPLSGCWPETDGRPDAVRIDWLAGHDDAVPAEAIQAMLLLIGHFYANREAVTVGEVGTPLPLGVEALLAPYRVWSL